MTLMMYLISAFLVTGMLTRRLGWWAYLITVCLATAATALYYRFNGFI
jgi:hypothetical protein